MSTFSPMLIFWYLFPMIVWAALQLLSSVFSLNKRFSIKAVDLTVPFLLFGIQKLSKMALGSSVLPYFLITLCLLGIGLAFFQAYFYDELEYRRFFKMYWRFAFLLCVILHIVLILLSILSFF